VTAQRTAAQQGEARRTAAGCGNDVEAGRGLGTQARGQTTGGRTARHRWTLDGGFIFTGAWERSSTMTASCCAARRGAGWLAASPRWQAAGRRTGWLAAEPSDLAGRGRDANEEGSRRGEAVLGGRRGLKKERAGALLATAPDEFAGKGTGPTWALHQERRGGRKKRKLSGKEEGVGGGFFSAEIVGACVVGSGWRWEAVKEDEHREENDVYFCEQRADGRNAMEREIAASGGPPVRHCEGESWKV
jgi:hypothetical protein